MSKIGHMYRNTQGLPEAVLSVKSYAHSVKGGQSHMAYMTRDYSLHAELDDGTIVRGEYYCKAVINDFYIAPVPGERTTMNLVVSSAVDGHYGQVTRAVREFGREEFGDRYWAFSMHTDTDNTHAHMIVKCRNRAGKQMRYGPAKLKSLRDTWARKLTEQGLEHHSSYRSERGETGTRRDPFTKKKRGVDHAREAEFKAKHQKEYRAGADYLMNVYGERFIKEAKDLRKFADNMKAMPINKKIEVGAEK